MLNDLGMYEILIFDIFNKYISHIYYLLANTFIYIYLIKRL